MELEEFHIFQRQAAPHDHGRAVAGEGVGVGGDLPDAAMPAGGKDDRLGMEDMHLAGGQLDRNHARGRPVDHQQVNRLEFVEEGHVVFHALLVERLQDHVTGAVGRMAGPPDRFAGHVIGMPAKRALGDLAIRRPVEGQAHVFQFVDGRHGLIAHELDRILVAQVIRAFDGIVGVPFGMVFFLAAERCADATLGGAGVRTGGVELGDNGGFGAPGGVQAGHEPRPACPHHQYFELMRYHAAAPSVSRLRRWR